MQREREVLGRAVRAVSEQAVKADALVDEAVAAGLDGSHPVTLQAKMLRLELLNVKADLERELGHLVLDCSPGSADGGANRRPDPCRVDDDTPALAPAPLHAGVLTVIALILRKIRWKLEFFVPVVLVISLLPDVPTVWLPAESMQLTDAEPVTAYVLSSDTAWTTPLRESDRSILILKTIEVLTRTVCNLQRVPSARTISQIIMGEEGGGRNPRCPDE